MQELKVTAVVLGASGVGKTSLCRQLTDQGFSESYVPTKGCDSYVIRRELIKEGVFVLKLWDLSGDENFDRIAPTFIQTTNTFCEYFYTAYLSAT